MSRDYLRRQTEAYIAMEVRDSIKKDAALESLKISQWSRRL